MTDTMHSVSPPLAQLLAHPLMRLHRAAAAMLQRRGRRWGDESCSSGAEGDPTGHTAAPASTHASPPDAPVQCTRCEILRRLPAPVPSSAADTPTVRDLYKSALELLPPFATLSPNLSQIALCGAGGVGAGDSLSLADGTQRADAAAAELGGVKSEEDFPVASREPAPLKTFVDAEGFLDWDACAEVMRQASELPTDADSSSAPSSCLDATAAPAVASPIRLSSTARAVLPLAESCHDYLTSLTPQQFRERYSNALRGSNHAPMGEELFAMGRGRDAGGIDASVSGAEAMMDPSSPRTGHSALVLLILSTHLERTLGDIFVRLCPPQGSTCPRMLRDLLLAPVISEFLPPAALWLLHSLVGSPRAFNLRNILWHGFVPLTDRDVDEVLAPFASAVWMVHLSILRLGEKRGLWDHPDSSSAGSAEAPRPEARVLRPLKDPALFRGDGILRAHLASALLSPSSAAPPSINAALSSSSSSQAAAAHDAENEFAHWPIPPSAVWRSSPSAFAALSSQVEKILSHSALLPHGRLHDLIFAWKLMRTSPFVSLAILLPSMEQSMREWFVYANAAVPVLADSACGNGASPSHSPSSFELNPRIELGLLFAQSERLFTTLDSALGEKVLPLDKGDAAAAAATLSPSPSPFEEGVSASPAAASRQAASASPSFSPSPSPQQPQQKCGNKLHFSFPLVGAPCLYRCGIASSEANALFGSSQSHPWLSLLPGAGIMHALGELLLSRAGPRLRDRVAHGEILWSQGCEPNEALPPWIVLYAFNLLLALACKCPLYAPLDPSSSTTRLPSVFLSPLALSAAGFVEGYIPVTHARSLVMQRIVAVLGAIEEVDQVASSYSIGAAERPGHEEANNDASILSKESIPLRTPLRSTYLWSCTHSLASPGVVVHHLHALASETDSRRPDLAHMSLWSNRMAVHSGMLLWRMRAREARMSLWNALPRWLLHGPDATGASSLSSLRKQEIPEWWTLSLHPWWNRSHTAMHHVNAQSTIPCSTTCTLHCHDACMAHAPVHAVERMIDLLLAVLAGMRTSVESLRQQADEVAAVEGATASKSQLLLKQVLSGGLSAAVACASVALVALAMLWEQLLSKAHPPGGASCGNDGSSSTASSSSFSSAASPLDRPSLLQQERSIARLLKQGSAALDRIRSMLLTHRWTETPQEWIKFLRAMDAWIELM